jgi:hypothetical protein
MSEREPSEESVLEAYFVQNGSVMLTTELTADAIKAAVSAAPLLSAAKDMQEALRNAKAQIRTLGTPDDAVNNAVIAQIDAALAKSKG